MHFSSLLESTKETAGFSRMALSDHMAPPVMQMGPSPFSP